jgi:polyhydroxyalkanoate synthase
MRLPSPTTLLDSASTAWDLLPVVGGGVADLRPWPSAIVDQGPQRTVHRYRSRKGAERKHAPVLLIPPLAAPASCFDLRRGASVVEHLVGRGYPTYVVDYGPISFADRALGLEHWVEDVIPSAIRTVSEDAGGVPVQPVGWCLGGIMLLLAAAADRDLPLASISLIASPFDFTELRMFAPIRQLGRLTGGALGTALYRALGGAPAPLVSLGFRITSYDRYLTRPWFLASNLDDREAIAHMEAVDDYMSNMLAYPGRTFGQLYHAFFRVNDLADGRIEMSDRTIDLRDVREPVLAVAGASDMLAPQPAVHHVGSLLEGAAEVRLETVPGGHLGTLTGMSAPTTTWAHLDDFLARHDEVARRAQPAPSGRRKPARPAAAAKRARR